MADDIGRLPPLSVLLGSTDIGTTFSHPHRKELHLGGQRSEYLAMSDYIVRATCPTCGDVVLTTRDLGMLVDPDGSRFLFDCPRCHLQVSRGLPTGIIHVLRAAGVAVIEPVRISDDDLGAFLADFDQADCLDQLRRLGRGA
jgi:predicted RNA-binding Zn-ribbon protein involved in translation (DUF1610 family)